MKSLLISLVVVAAACTQAKTTNTSAVASENSGLLESKEALPQDAEYLVPLTNGILSSVETMLVASCPACEGGSTQTMVQIDVPYTECNKMLPVQARAVKTASGKHEILVAAVEVVTAVSHIADCSQATASVRVSLEGEVKKKDISLKFLGLKKN